MHFFLEKKQYGDPTSFAAIGERPYIEGINWYHGARFDRDIPQPFRCELDPEIPGVMPWFFKVPVPLMHQEMIQAFLEAGVDNLDCYDAVIVDPEDGSERTDYKAVNIIGQIAAADLAKSRFDPKQPHRMVAMSFDSVEIDAARIGGPLLFRLAECVTGIVIHERVRDHLISKGIEPLGFIEPKSWLS